MALIFIGHTQCIVCNKMFVEVDVIIGLPPISDTANPLYEYFDAGVHKSCYDQWDIKDEIESIIRKEISN